MRKLAVCCLLSLTVWMSSLAQHDAHRFPTLTANLLSNDQEVTFPDFLQGKKAMIALVFEKRGDYKQAQGQADNWRSFWSTELQEQGVDFYEVPMMSGIYWVGSSFINSGMRSGLDQTLHDKVACFYGKKMKYAEELGISDISQCYVCVLDENGNIIVSEVGAISETKKQAFLDLMN